MGILREAAVVAAVGMSAGIGINALSPHPAALGRPVHAAAEASACSPEPAAAAMPRVGAAEAARLCAACAAGFVDARGASEYAAGHASGAVHLPPAGHPDEAAALAALSGFKTIVVYDGDASCGLADGVARHLQRKGFGDVRVLAGSWPAWLAVGGPGASGACAVCGHDQRAEASR
jgi:3-mercaptopyruvate sulfurtransferase SseA